MVANTMSTFVSLTVHCARCHDHKFDPIPQRDYYRLQAVFAGVDRGNRPCGDREVVRRRSALEARRREISARRAALLSRAAAVTSPALTGADRDVQRLRQELAALPDPAAGAKRSRSNGYHSGIAPRPDVRKWVQVDLGRSLPLSAVRLVPARPVDFPDTPGFGLDCADPNINTPVRNTTLTALQALALLNDPFMVKQSELLAERLRQVGPEPGRQIEAAYRLCFARPPRPGERAALAAYVRKHGLAYACRVLFNANEFVFID
jgi:hypothetical protein